MKDDTFEHGQWLKNRIYERRCDLSPDGKKLLYFAASHKRPYYSWTAISNPPYLTALALWKGLGTWEGGGLFESNTTILTYQFGGLAEGSKLGKNVKVRDFRGDSEAARLSRDGWSVVRSFEQTTATSNAEIYWNFGTTPITLRKVCTRNHEPLVLDMKIVAIGKQGAGRYSIDHEVIGKNGDAILSLPNSDWADWDATGDLLHSVGGKLFRTKFPKRCQVTQDVTSIELGDFSDLQFEAVEAPNWALNW